MSLHVNPSPVPDTDGRHIFNHDIASCTHKDVVGNYLYSGRVLGLSGPDDVVQLHPFLKKEWPAIIQHYRRIDLAHSEHAIWDTSLKALREYPDLSASVFYFGKNENKVRPDSSRMNVVNHINSKNNFVALASHLRVDIPKTLCFRSKEWFAGIDSFPYPCYVKAAKSVAGKGIFRCESPQEVIQALAWFKDGVPIQVQEEVNATIFLNLQYYASNSGLTRWLATEQILDGYTHEGNRYPARCEPWETVELMAQWLYRKGMKGIFAFDVALIEEQDGPRHIPIECNPRFNGASYPSGIACKLGLDSWVAKEYNTRHKRLDEINLAGIEFDPDTKTGVILVNWGTILVGKLSVLIAGTETQQSSVEAELLNRL